MEPGTVTVFLRRLHAGDDAAYNELMPLLYDQLRRIAQQRLKKERPNHTLGATALVNEVYLRFVNQNQLQVADRNEFLAVASTAMRNILVDYARTKKRIKRGGDFSKIPLEEIDTFLSEEEASEVLRLDEAFGSALEYERTCRPGCAVSIFRRPYTRRNR